MNDLTTKQKGAAKTARAHGKAAIPIVPVERLKALEEDRWDALPDLVFARALAQSVCRQLKIEPGPVLSAMPDPDPMRSVRVTAATSQPLGGLASGSVLSQKRGLVIALVVLFGALG